MARFFRLDVGGEVRTFSIQNNLPPRQGNETNMVLIDTLECLGASWTAPADSRTVVLSNDNFDTFVSGELEEICTN